MFQGPKSNLLPLNLIITARKIQHMYYLLPLAPTINITAHARHIEDDQASANQRTRQKISYEKVSIYDIDHK